MSDLLLDTCAVIWAGSGARMTDRSVAAITEAQTAGRPVSASPFTAWEIGTLVSRERLRLTYAPADWFRRFLRRGNVTLTDLSPELLVDSSFLPGNPPRDPADRIIIATARASGMTVVTRDRQILDYADAGHVMALEC